MKKLIVSLVSLLIFLPLQSVIGQDKIITIQNDTIFCRILSVSDTHIQYEQNEDGYTVGKFIPTEQVLEYFRNFQSSENTSNYQSLQPVRKHYLGFRFTNGVGGYSGYGWDENFFDVGFMYAHRRGDSEIGVGVCMFASDVVAVSLPVTVKKYLGEHVFIGFGLAPGYYDKDFSIGASVMLGVEVVSKGGLSFSLTPNLQYTIINLLQKEVKVKSNFGGSYTQIQSTEVLRHAGITIGIGFRF